ncbi:hypothetical protein U1Q18_046649 [Sarracenia purpurea var. burkii]
MLFIAKDGTSLSAAAVALCLDVNVIVLGLAMAIRFWQICYRVLLPRVCGVWLLGGPLCATGVMSCLPCYLFVGDIPLWVLGSFLLLFLIHRAGVFYEWFAWLAWHGGVFTKLAKSSEIIQQPLELYQQPFGYSSRLRVAMVGCESQDPILCLVFYEGGIKLLQPLSFA